MLSVNAASALYAPAQTASPQSALPTAVQQGIQIVQNAETVGVPYYVSINERMQAALDNMLRRLLADPQAGKVFDLDALLSTLEAVRQAQ